MIVTSRSFATAADERRRSTPASANEQSSALSDDGNDETHAGRTRRVTCGDRTRAGVQCRCSPTATSWELSLANERGRSIRLSTNERRERVKVSGDQRRHGRQTNSRPAKSTHDCWVHRHGTRAAAARGGAQFRDIMATQAGRCAVCVPDGRPGSTHGTSASQSTRPAAM